jgi:hypothetical protein
MGALSPKWNATGGNYLIARQVMQAQRKAGATFDDAFELALRMVSREDRLVLQETRHAWEKGYQRESFHSGASFSLLANGVDGDGARRHDTRIIA